jgi:hypothetical protein
VMAADTDVEQTVRFSIVGGADAGLFKINSITGALAFTAAPNFEAPGDTGGDNVYEVTVQAADDSGIDTQVLAVTVTDTDEDPTITSNGGGYTAAVFLAENSTAVTTVTAAPSVAGRALTFSIEGGADAHLFTINPMTGALALVAPPNFEAPTDSDGNNVYKVTVQVSDGEGGTTKQDIAVVVTNVNEPPAITSNGGNNTATASIGENTTAVTTITATDPDVGQNMAFSIVGGADAALFTLNPATGALSFSAAPNFEAPADSDHDNSYLVQVRSSDGTLFADQIIVVTVLNVNEAPAITSNGGGEAAAVSHAENTTAATTVTARDPDVDASLSYAITGGSDAGKFTLNASTGALAFVAAPDFENPGDTDHDNSYVVQIRVSDGTLFDTQTVTVAVADVVEQTDFNSAGLGDFGGNGRSDLLWFSDTGQVAIWQTNSSGMLGPTLELGATPSSWHIEGTGDFNHDSRSDILFRNDDGQLAVWQATLGGVGTHVLGTASSDWQASGMGDFNGDGTSDLLFRNADGQIGQWLINNNQLQSSTVLGSTSAAFRVVAINDFNGDGKADLLFRDDAGVLATWLVNGNHVQSIQVLGSTGTDWHLVGTGDFNGDGKSDLLWRNDNGQMAEWLMNGAAIQSIETIGTAAVQYHVEGTGDLNGDGRSDILFRDTAGTLVEWLMNGAAIQTAQVLGSASTDFHLAAHHFDLV